MTASTHCFTRDDKYPKERFASEQAARRAVARKRKFRNRRYPRIFHCPCGGYHLTGSV